MKSVWPEFSHLLHLLQCIAIHTNTICNVALDIMIYTTRLSVHEIFILELHKLFILLIYEFLISYTEHFSYKFHLMFMEKCINKTFVTCSGLGLGLGLFQVHEIDNFMDIARYFMDEKLSSVKVSCYIMESMSWYFICHSIN